MKNIIVLSHCILNNAAKVSTDESGLKTEYALRNRLLKLILENDIQVIQLPCPEFILYGANRWGHVKSQFKHPHFSSTCEKLIKDILLQLKEYDNHKDRFNVMAIVSVEGSPSCGKNLTCEGDWFGELGQDVKKISNVLNSCNMVSGSGVFIEIIEDNLKKMNLGIPIITLEEAIELITKNSNSN